MSTDSTSLLLALFVELFLACVGLMALAGLVVLVVALVSRRL